MWQQAFLSLGIIGLSATGWATALSPDAFLTNLKTELAAEGRDLAVFEQAMNAGQFPNDKVVEKVAVQPEFTFSFSNYFNRLVSDNRVNKGIALRQQWQTELEATGQKYQVNPNVVVALWGIETYYGTYTGGYAVVPALASLVYHGHRVEFFRKELSDALKILEAGHVSPADFTGSWAGALGQCQFMPSSFWGYAADGNNDGKKDIWNTEPDVFASAANYLAKHGWQDHQPWSSRVILTKYLPADLKLSERGLGEIMPVAELKKLGITPAQGGWPAGVTEARLFLPEGPSKKAYVVFNNFEVIMKWNRSSAFAFSVLSLADRIGAGA